MFRCMKYQLNMITIIESIRIYLYIPHLSVHKHQHPHPQKRATVT